MSYFGGMPGYGSYPMGGVSMGAHIMSAPTMSYAAPVQTMAAPVMQAPVQTYTQPMMVQPQQTERQVYTEQVTIPQQYTTMVPQTTYQNKTIQVPVQQQVR